MSIRAQGRGRSSASTRQCRAQLDAIDAVLTGRQPDGGGRGADAAVAAQRAPPQRTADDAEAAARALLEVREHTVHIL